MKIRAYNLVPGAGFRLEGDLFGRVVTKIERDVNLEVVYGRDHWGRPFTFDFNEYIDLVGLDANLGTESDVGTPGSIDLGTDSDMSEVFAQDEDDTVARDDAVIMALSELGFTPEDQEHNRAVQNLYVALSNVPSIELIEAIRLPRV